jgi:tetratricopeptide (TPR) repeat protein
MGLQSMLDGLRDWRDRRRVFGELRKLRAADAPYDYADTGAILQTMINASFREDTAATLRAWELLNQRAPDLAITSGKAMRALFAVKQADVAEAALSRALERFSGDFDVAQLYAEAAIYRGDFEESARRWTIVLQRFPRLHSAYVLKARCLIKIGRLDEAEGLLLEAQKMNTPDEGAATDFAGIANLRGDWEEALRRWDDVRKDYPVVEAWIGVATAQRELGRRQEAIGTLTVARGKFLNSHRPSVELAWMAHNAKDWPEALRLWQAVRESFPRLGTGYVAGAWALREAGQLEEAEAVLGIGTNLLDQDAGPAADYARFAHRRGDWPEAVRRWALVRERFPGEKSGYTEGADALEAAGDHAAAAAVRAAAPG